MMMLPSGVKVHIAAGVALSWNKVAPLLAAELRIFARTLTITRLFSDAQSAQ